MRAVCESSEWLLIVQYYTRRCVTVAHATEYRVLVLFSSPTNLLLWHLELSHLLIESVQS